MIKTKCAYQIEDFPWDVQHCSIKLSSWAYNLDRIEIDVDYYTPNMDFQYFVGDANALLHLYLNSTVRSNRPGLKLPVSNWCRCHM